MALVLQIPAANIRVAYMEGSGCYVLNGNDSASLDAALLSQAVGTPVRVKYSRKDEMTSGRASEPPMSPI